MRPSDVLNKDVSSELTVRPGRQQNGTMTTAAMQEFVNLAKSPKRMSLKFSRSEPRDKKGS